MPLAIDAARPHASRSWNKGKRTTDIDLHVALRLKAARKLAGLSQTRAAEGIGVTFQQLQKYESGSNRISCGKLAALAKVYNVSIDWLFDGAITVPVKGGQSDISIRLIGAPRGADIAKHFLAISNVDKRNLLVDLAEALSK